MILQGKAAVITGAGRGIGQAIALAFAREGASSVLVARTAKEISETAGKIHKGGGKAVEFPADVADSENAEKAVHLCIQKFGRIDILVNSAGVIGPIGPMEEETPEDWRRTIEIDLTATFLWMRAALPHMKKQKSGKIINLSGGGASFARPMYAAYAASKVAVVRLTESVAEEVKADGIDINALAPGAVNTRLFEDMLAAGDRAGVDEHRKLKDQKQKGGAPPERAADLAVFLASSRSNGLSGKLIAAVWDTWHSWTPEDIQRIQTSDLYTLRRVVPPEQSKA